MREIWCLMRMKFCSKLSTEPTYQSSQPASVSTQFSLMMDPPHMCNPEYSTDTCNSSTLNHWTEMRLTTAFIWHFYRNTHYKCAKCSTNVLKKRHLLYGLIYCKYYAKLRLIVSIYRAIAEDWWTGNKSAG